MTDNFVKWNGRESTESWHKRMERKVLKAAISHGMSYGYKATMIAEDSPVSAFEAGAKKYVADGVMYKDGELFPLEAYPFWETVRKAPESPDPDTPVYIAKESGVIAITTTDFNRFSVSWIGQDMPLSAVTKVTIAQAKRAFKRAVEETKGVNGTKKEEVAAALRPLHRAWKEGRI
jgi:hypothetical protein